MPNNIPLPLDTDPFGSFIQHDLDLDELTDETDEDGEEAEGDGDTVDMLRRRFGSRPSRHPRLRHPSRVILLGAGGTLSGTTCCWLDYSCSRCC